MATGGTSYSISGITIDRYKDTFFQIDRFADMRTVAYSILEIDGRKIREIQTTSSSGNNTHAEIAFIEQAETVLERLDNIQGRQLTVVIMLSKSPCFNCREDLEAFLESLTKRGARANVTFILRIAHLYYREGGGEEQIIERLARWRCYLREEKIVDYFALEPILVTTELKNYRTRSIKKKYWTKVVIKKRGKKDKDIQKQVKTIIQRSEIQIELTAAQKRQFYKSRPATKENLVIVQPIQIFAVNKHGTVKKKKGKQITQSPDSTFENTVKKIAEQIEDIPKCWELTRIDLTVMATHFPDIRLLTGLPIKRYMLYVCLQVANIDVKLTPYSTVIDILNELHEHGITVRLEPVRVTQELMVSCSKKEHFTEQDKADRLQWDDEVTKQVDEILPFTLAYEFKRLCLIDID